MKSVDPPESPVPVGGYSSGVIVDPAFDGPLLFISGQTPECADGTVADDPEGQLRQVWANVSAVLHEAGAELGSLVQVRTFLADRRFRDANSRVRQQVLGEHRPALTVVVCQLFESDWVAEIEAVAVVPANPRLRRLG